MLNDTTIKNLKATGEDYKRTDSAGLYVFVTAKGTKSFRYNYRFAGKRRTLVIGTYPDVSLAEARRARDDARAMLRKDSDPNEAKRERERALIRSANDTFEAVAREWLENREAGWTSDHAEEVERRLVANIFPTLGSRPIGEISSTEILDAVRKIEKRRAHEQTRKVLGDVKRVFRYAVLQDRIKFNPAAELRGALAAAPKPQNRPALKAPELPTFFRKLNADGGHPRTHVALRLTIYTLLRTSEIRYARWSEFDPLDAPDAMWRIPAERMKEPFDHVVPLAPQVISLLLELKSLPGSGATDFLFPSAGKYGVMSENTMLQTMHRLGYKGHATVHGFRRLASTVLNEAQFNRDAIERQLSHDERDAVRGAYNHAQYLPERRALMQHWANFVAAADVDGDNLIVADFKARA